MGDSTCHLETRQYEIPGTRGEHRVMFPTVCRAHRVVKASSGRINDAAVVDPRTEMTESLVRIAAGTETAWGGLHGKCIGSFADGPSLLYVYLKKRAPAKERRTDGKT